MVCYALAYFFFCLTATFSLFAFFQKRINFTTKLLGSLSANSYPIYFIHYFLMLVIILALRGLQWNVFIKFLLVGIFSVTVSYLVSKYALSKTPIFGGPAKPILVSH